MTSLRDRRIRNLTRVWKLNKLFRLIAPLVVKYATDSVQYLVRGEFFFVVVVKITYCEGVLTST